MQDKFLLVEIIFAHFTAEHIKKHGGHCLLSSLLFTFCQKESKLSDAEKVRTDQEGQIFVENNAYCQMDWWEIKCLEFENTRD